jgi:hypothetical protein
MPCMRTTIRIQDELYRKVKVRAAESGRTLGEVIEDAVRSALLPRASGPSELPRLPTYGSGGTLPGVDISNNAALLDLMEEDLPLDARR